MKHKLPIALLKVYDGLSRSHKRLLLGGVDGVVFSLALILAIALRFGWEGAWTLMALHWWKLPLFVLLKLLVFRFAGVYKPILRYSGLEFLVTVFLATALSSGVWLVLSLHQGLMPFSRAVLIVDALFTLVLVVASRLLVRALLQRLYGHILGDRAAETVIIYGAGVAGVQLANTLKHEPGYRVLAFVDDNPEIQGRLLKGHRIYKRSELQGLIESEAATTLVLAMPSIGHRQRRAIFNSLKKLPIQIKTVPSLPELLTQRHSLGTIRPVEVADLLGREEVLPEPALLSLNISGKAVLVTGAGGSIGSQLCREIAALEPKLLVLYELNEYALYTIDLELAKAFPHLSRFAYLGNVTDRPYFASILHNHAVDTIYHAAAYKHVPLVEANPAQGIQNNILGTMNTAQCAIAARVKNYVLISTDKAVRPTNIMGTTKRCAELTIQALADTPHCPTCFGIVRFGNVLDSSGSVVPRFRQQIAAGQPLTVTHPDVTRYFMSIPEAVRLVIQAGAMATGGDVFLLEMGEPVRIYDLAQQMIQLSGLEVGKDVEIKITGLRPGEKLYEELLIDGDNIQPTKHPKIFSAHEYKLSWSELEPMLNALFYEAQINDQRAMITQLCKLVPEYRPDDRLLAQVAQTPAKPLHTHLSNEEKIALTNIVKAKQTQTQS